MIDTHSHLLHGIDDGPAAIEGTLEMCRVAWEDGIRVIVATPHSLDGRFVNSPDEIRSRVANLNTELRSRGMGLTVLPGMELRVSVTLMERITRDQLLPLNGGRYVLLELHPFHVPAGLDNLVRHLRDAGFGTILAHPEKNAVIQRDPGYLFRLIGKFAPWEFLVQMTADSLTGHSGFWVRRTAGLLLRNGLAHLIATDAHSPSDRPPRLAEAVRKASGVVGEARAHQMVGEIPMAVLMGKPFPEPWEIKEPRPWWRFL